MTTRPLRILQVSTADIGGGAESSARNLFRIYRDRGRASWLAVGRKGAADPDVFEIPSAPVATTVGRALQAVQGLLRPWRARVGAVRRVSRWLGLLADPQRLADWRRGVEDFNFPGSRRVLELPPERPDVLHCHNLHGWYFDLRALPELSRQVPVVLNLRDAWLLTGHCGHFFDCERWRTGCGACPDLTVYPAIRRDASAENWRRKADIYARSRLYVTAPSQWLMQCAADSMLGGVVRRVIPNGIDLSVFRPGDRSQARRELGLPANAHVVLFAAASAKRSAFKDYGTMAAAVAEIAARGEVEDVLFVCLGEGGRPQSLPNLRIRSVPFERDPARVASFYRAADVYVHAARAEAFGKSITEAMACGTPVVATRVGGIPEQVVDGSTGLLTPPGDAHAMAVAAEQLLSDPELRAACAAAAVERAREFSLERQADRFLEWYGEVVDDFKSCAGR